MNWDLDQDPVKNFGGTITRSLQINFEENLFRGFKEEVQNVKCWQQQMMTDDRQWRTICNSISSGKLRPAVLTITCLVVHLVFRFSTLDKIIQRPATDHDLRYKKYLNIEPDKKCLNILVIYYSLKPQYEHPRNYKRFDLTFNLTCVLNKSKFIKVWILDKINNMWDMKGWVWIFSHLEWLHHMDFNVLFTSLLNCVNNLSCRIKYSNIIVYHYCFSNTFVSNHHFNIIIRNQQLLL